MDTTPHPTGDSTLGSLPNSSNTDDDVAALADLDPADAPEAAEQLARRLAAELDAESAPPSADPKRGESL
jgi:hypothetical protein